MAQLRSSESVTTADFTVSVYTPHGLCQIDTAR